MMKPRLLPLNPFEEPQVCFGKEINAMNLLQIQDSLFWSKFAGAIAGLQVTLQNKLAG